MHDRGSKGRGALATLLAAGALLVGGIAGCMHQPPEEIARNDTELATQVAREIQEELEGRETVVEVGAEDGRVTLAGRVRTEEQRASASEVANQVEGVTGVENRIKVADASRHPSAEIPPGREP